MSVGLSSALGIIASSSPDDIVAPGFDPIGDVSIPCELLLRSDAGVIDSGGAVSVWEDQSGNGRDFAQATGGNKPITGTRSQNGINVLDFDNDHYMMSGVFTIDPPYTMVCVCLKDSIDDVIFSGQTSNNHQFRDAGGPVFRYRDSNAVDSVIATNVNPNIHVMKVVGAGDLDWWINGAIEITDGGIGGDSETDGYMVGTRIELDTFLDGWIGVFGIYDGAMSDVDRNYLEAGWGALFGISVT